MHTHIAEPLAIDINTALTINRKVVYQPIDCEAVRIIEIDNDICLLEDGSEIDLLLANRDSFYFIADTSNPSRIKSETEERKESLKNPITWAKAKADRLLVNPVLSLLPTDKMFNDDGYLYPTRLYPLSRKKLDAKLLPVKYDIDYILSFYQERVIKQLSLDNQLTLLKAITELYSEAVDTARENNDVSIIDSFNSLDDDTKLATLKQLAKTLGKRVIANK